jgi:hypothetical protein
MNKADRKIEPEEAVKIFNKMVESFERRSALELGKVSIEEFKQQLEKDRLWQLVVQAQ